MSELKKKDLPRISISLPEETLNRLEFYSSNFGLTKSQFIGIVLNSVFSQEYTDDSNPNECAYRSCAAFLTALADATKSKNN